MEFYFTIWFAALIYALGGYLLTCLKEYESKINKH
jgi:hypothetical protein